MDWVEFSRAPEAPDPGEQDGAEQAFEALREEVAALRRGIELAYRQAQDAKGSGAGPGPDYSRTLGAIAKELKAVGARLDGIERAPTLAIAPAAQAAELRRELLNIGQDARDRLAHSQAQLDGTVRALRGMIGSARDHEDSAAVALNSLCVRGHGRRAVMVHADRHSAMGRRHIPGGPGLLAALERRRGDDAGREPGAVGAHGQALQSLPTGQHDRTVRSGRGRADHSIRAGGCEAPAFGKVSPSPSAKSGHRHPCRHDPL